MQRKKKMGSVFGSESIVQKEFGFIVQNCQRNGRCTSPKDTEILTQTLTDLAKGNLRRVADGIEHQKLHQQLYQVENENGNPDVELLVEKHKKKLEHKRHVCEFAYDRFIVSDFAKQHGFFTTRQHWFLVGKCERMQLCTEQKDVDILRQILVERDDKKVYDEIQSARNLSPRDLAVRAFGYNSRWPSTHDTDCLRHKEGVPKEFEFQVCKRAQVVPFVDET